MGAVLLSGGIGQTPILAQRWVIVRCSPRWKGAVRGRNDSLPSGTGVGTRGPYRCGGGGVEDRSRRIVRSKHQQTPLLTGIALMSPRARRLLPLLIGLALILPAVVPAPVAASASDAEAMILKKMNYERTKRGSSPCASTRGLAAIARDRSRVPGPHGGRGPHPGLEERLRLHQRRRDQVVRGRRDHRPEPLLPERRGLGRSSHQGLARLVDPPLDPAVEGLQLRRLRLRDEPRQPAPLLDGRLHEGPRPHGAVGPDRGRLEAERQRRIHRGQDPLGPAPTAGCRSSPPGSATSRSSAARRG